MAVATLLKQSNLAVRLEASPLVPAAARLPATPTALARLPVAKAPATAAAAPVRDQRASTLVRAPRNAATQYPFTDDVLHYLETREPALAALLCLLHSPVAVMRQSQHNVSIALDLTKVRLQTRLGPVSGPSATLTRSAQALRPPGATVSCAAAALHCAAIPLAGRHGPGRVPASVRRRGQHGHGRLVRSSTRTGTGAQRIPIERSRAAGVTPQWRIGHVGAGVARSTPRRVSRRRTRAATKPTPGCPTAPFGSWTRMYVARRRWKPARGGHGGSCRAVQVGGRCRVWCVRAV